MKSKLKNLITKLKALIKLNKLRAAKRIYTLTNKPAVQTVRTYTVKTVFCLMWGAIYLLALRFAEVELTILNLMSATAMYFIVQEAGHYIKEITNSKPTIVQKISDKEYAKALIRKNNNKGLQKIKTSK